jgi:prepilin-type processing-associated H-X9-DG protein
MARSYHGDGVNTVFADGSVRYIGGGIELSVWQALGTINGGEAINGGSY